MSLLTNLALNISMRDAGWLLLVFVTCLACSKPSAPTNAAPEAKVPINHGTNDAPTNTAIEAKVPAVDPTSDPPTISSAEPHVPTTDATNDAPMSRAVEAKVPAVDPTKGAPIRATPDEVAKAEVTDAAPPKPPPQAIATSSADWPCWLGPDHNSISHEKNWKTSWRPQGPPIAWRAEIGIGFSTVSIANGRLYTMGYRDGKDFVYCFDAVTGEKKWEHSYVCELVDNLHEGGPGATPTVAGELLYTLSREGHLHCLSAATGEVKWLRQFKQEIDAEQPDWGFTSSPCLSENLVLVDVGFVVAVDRTTGQIVWKSVKHRAGYGTPVEFENAGRRLIAVFNNDGLFILAAEDGREVASYPLESQFATTSTTPIIVQNTFFVSVGYGGGCALLRLSGNLLEQVYANKEMANHFNNCVLLDGHLYGFDGNSHVSSQVRLVCMEHATGNVKWSQRGFGCGSLMIADGKLILLSDSGTLAIATATPVAFQELARADVLNGRCWTMPVLIGGRIYCRNAAGDLVCVDVRG